MEYGPVQVQPPGLLGLLQLKNLGRNPDKLLAEVRPTIELGEWYASQDKNMAYATVSSGFANTYFVAMTTPVPITIPQGQWWYVWAIQGDVQLQAADVWASELRVIAKTPLSSPLTATTSLVNMELGCSPGYFFNPAGAVASLQVGVQPRRLFGPGTQFGLGWAQAVLGANRTFGLGIEYTILPG